jgi:tRNA A37 N6-isopentenylltransferase MiaA
MKIIGCKEIISYFNQNISYDECLEQMVKANKRYAKKQLT